jgi:parvulin-like peptidyl-prolyl isomerase
MPVIECCPIALRRRLTASPRLPALLLLACSLTVGGCGRGAEEGEAVANGLKPVAIVDDDTVSVEETVRYMQGARVERTQEGLKHAVEDLIAVELVKFAAGKEPLTPEQEALRKEWESQLKMYQFRDSVIYKTVSVPDSAVQAFYRNRIGEEVKARHILVGVSASATPEEKRAARQKAEEALAKARKGEDFAELSRRYSEPKTAAARGDLGWFGKGDMVPAFERAAFALKPGEISDVVETRFGFHVIKAEDRRRQTLEEVRGQIVDAIGAPLRKEAEDRYVERMMGESRLEFYEANIDTAVAIFQADSVGELAPARRDLPLATWDKGRLTVGDIVERYRLLPEENRAAVRALDRDRMMNALAPLVKNEMILARAEEQGIELDPSRKKKLEERMQGLVVADMMKRHVKEDVTVSDSAVNATYRADSARYGKSLKEAEPAIRRGIIQERLARANSWEGQLEIIRAIAANVKDRAPVQRIEENYRLVTLELEKLPVPGKVVTTAPGESGAPATTSGASDQGTSGATSQDPPGGVSASPQPGTRRGPQAVSPAAPAPATSRESEPVRPPSGSR